MAVSGITHQTIASWFNAAGVPIGETDAATEARLERIFQQIIHGERTVDGVKASIASIASGQTSNEGATKKTYVPGTQTPVTPAPEGGASFDMPFNSGTATVTPEGITVTPTPPAAAPGAGGLPSRELMQAVIAGLGMPAGLIDKFIELWVQEGNSADALALLRNDRPFYDQYFPGNRAADGSLRHSEQEYNSIIAGYENVVTQRGLDPGLFSSAGTWARGIENRWSVLEFESGVSALEEGIFQRGDEIIEAFSQASGGIAFTREAALTALIDENLGNELLTRKISVAQVRGTGARFGFNRSIERGNDLVNAGVGEAGARDFYSSAGRNIGFFDAAARRFNDADSDVDVDELERATLLGDDFQRQRLMGLQQREVSNFSRSSGVRQSRDGALAGLEER